MGLQKFANNAAGTTTTSLSIGGTTFTLQSGEGAKFPALGAGEYCYIRLGTDVLNEVVKVTARAGDVFTCVATASAWSAGVPAILSVSKEMLTEFMLSEDIVTTYDAAVAVVSQGDAEAGTSTTAVRWTPERVKQAIAALAIPQSSLLSILTKLLTPVTITSTANAVAWNSDNGYNFKCTLNQNTTVSATTGTPYDGQKVQFAFTQGATPGTIAWNAAFIAGADFTHTIPVAGTAVGDIDVYLFQYVSGISKYILLSHLKH